MPLSCPSCGSRGVVRIVYGFVDQSAYEEGSVRFGGCVLSGDSPNWHCNKCGHEWRGKGGDSLDRQASELKADYLERFIRLGKKSGLDVREYERVLARKKAKGRR
jgi:hypothetical protein